MQEASKTLADKGDVDSSKTCLDQVGIKFFLLVTTYWYHVNNVGLFQILLLLFVKRIKQNSVALFFFFQNLKFLRNS
jgi:hypothetical protein